MPKLSPRIDASDTVEYRDLYDPPHFNENDRNYFFNLNDLETSTLKQFRIVQNKAHFILLLGYFKAKPVTLTFTWGMVKSDLTHIYARYFPKARLIRKNLNKDAKSNIYQKVFSLTSFQRFSEQHQKRLHKQADSAVAIRADNKTVFDECVTYLNQQWIALPALSRIQSIVSQALNKEEERLITLFNRQLKGSIKDYITALLAPHQTTDEFRTLRNQAKDFTFGEISRELQDKQKLYRGLRKYGQSASQFSDKQIAKEASRLGKQVKKVSDVLHVLASGATDETMLAKALLNKIYKILPQSDLASVADFMEKVELDKKQFIWQYYSQNKATIRRNLRRLFLTLEFEIDKAHFELANQVNLAKQEIRQYGEIKTIDEELIRNSDLAYLQNDDRDNPTVDPFLFECYLYRKVLQALDNDVCYIHHSHQYRPLDDYLIDRADQKQLSSSMSLPMLKVTISELSAGLKGLLEEQMKNTSKRINQGENDYVIYSDQTNTIKWSLSVKNPVPTVNNRVFEQFEQIGIIELMRVVNQKTNFFDEFTHFQSKYQRTQPNLNDILACILGNGTNFGLYKIANISDRSFNDLRAAQASYLRMETLRAANDAISNKTASLPIFEYYQIDEHGQHGSIDGQKFECRFSSLMARYSPKYFGQDKGVSAMTLVLNHIPANSKIISADDHESHHIFDLLYNNTSDVKPDILSTDTHGANRYNFAILHFFGYQFAP